MNTQEMLQGVKNYIDTQDAGLIYDISEANAESGIPAIYSDLLAALGPSGANVPTSVRSSGMTVKFIQQLYTVVKTTSSSAPSGGTSINSDPGIGNGSAYTAADLSAFSSLPTTSSVVYYLSDGESTPIYTIWTISKNAIASCSYVQCRYMGTSTSTGFTTITNWQGVDSTPTAGSKNLVESSGVAEELALGTVFDVTAHNNGVTFASLSALLSDANLSTLIPTSVRRGGMSIKFVQTSDNKYIQARCTANEFTTDTTQWAIAEEGVYVDNSEFVYVKTDAEGKILWAIKTDGSIYYGAGCPQQVKDYIEEKISSLPLDEYEDIVAFLSDYLGSDTTLKVMIDSINERIPEVIENLEYIQATTDSEGKILESITSEGTKEIKIPTIVKEDATVQGDLQVNGDIINNKLQNRFESIEDVTYYFDPIHNSEYIEAKTDSEHKILEGYTKEGVKKINTPVELPTTEISYIDNSKWLDVKIDESGRIIEGITKEGEKYISQFDKETENYIKELGGETNSISIPLLDANFNSPIPVTITGTKGNEDAKYEFELPLSEDAFNIRFKFRITENILNQEKSAVIASINGAEVNVVPVPLVQCQTETTFDGETKTVNWPTTDGGLKFNNGSLNKMLFKQHLGQQAFSVKYLGTSDATIENTGTAIVLTINNVATSYIFSQYFSVTELYEDMASNPDIEVKYLAIDGRTCDELAIFGPVALRAKFYCDDKGSYAGSSDYDRQEHIDNAPFYLRYAVSTEWHQVEIVKINDIIYSVCDGNMLSFTNINTNNILTLGGECGVLFKEVVICSNGISDAEIIDGLLVSSVNPYILIFEAHGVYDGPSYEAKAHPESTQDGMSSLTPDALEIVFSKLEQKGYVPVSTRDIAQWCVTGCSMPKRCYTMIFDDYRWPVCLNLEIRQVFSKHGAKPALAMITNRESTPIYNGEPITKEEAVKICHNNDFELVSHTSNHRSTSGLKPSQYREWLLNDIVYADLLGVDGSIIVYPGGASDEYMPDVLEDIGIKCGISTPGGEGQYNIKRNRFFLTRADMSNINYDYSRFLGKIY